MPADNIPAPCTPHNLADSSCPHPCPDHDGGDPDPEETADETRERLKREWDAEYRDERCQRYRLGQGYDTATGEDIAWHFGRHCGAPSCPWPVPVAHVYPSGYIRGTHPHLADGSVSDHDTLKDIVMDMSLMGLPEHEARDEFFRLQRADGSPWTDRNFGAMWSGAERKATKNREAADADYEAWAQILGSVAAVEAVAGRGTGRPPQTARGGSWATMSRRWGK
jgi:hypothetical protein